MQQVTAVKYVNCFYSFSDRVVWKEWMPSKVSNFGIMAGVMGYLFCFVCEEGKDILVVGRWNHAWRDINDYAQEIYMHLEQKCLLKNHNHLLHSSSHIPLSS